MIADDFDAIAARLKYVASPLAPKVEPEPEQVCATCCGVGWECYGTGHMDPHFRTCTECGNPEGHPSP